MELINGFLPFSAIDKDKDNLISFEEFIFTLPAFTISKTFDTGNLVSEEAYKNNYVWHIKGKSENPATFLWYCMAENEEVKISKETYESFLNTINNYIEFTDEWDINIKDLTLPNLQRALENFSKYHVRLQGGKLL